MATFLGTQADPAPIIIRQQRTLYTQYAAAPLPPGPWPMPYRGAASTLVPADLSEDVFMPDEPPPGGLGAFVAAGAGLCGVHQPEHESQLLSGSPSPEHAFAHHAAAVGPALVSNPPAAAAQPASVGAARDGAAIGDSKPGTCEGSAADTAATPCAAAIKAEPQSGPVGFAASAALLAPSSTKGRRPARCKAPPPALAIKAEPRSAAKLAGKAPARKTSAGRKAAAALLSAVKEECKTEVEDAAPAGAAAASRGGSPPGSPSPRHKRRRRRGGGRRKPTGNKAGRPRGGASPYDNLTQDDMFAYVTDKGGDVLGCSKQEFAAKWGVNTSGFMTKCQAFVRDAVKPHLTDLKLILKETNPVSRAGSIVLDRARIKRERLTNWPAFAARYLRPPVHPG